MNLQLAALSLPIFALIPALPCLADSPLPPPSTAIVRSLSGRFFAQTNPRSNTTTVYQSAPRGHKARRMWQMKGWFRALYLANDGAHIVASYSGLNLLALRDARPQTVMLRFFKRGKLLRRVTLDGLGLSKSQLRRTVSHYAWRDSEGFEKSGLFRVSLVDGRRLFFEARTGSVARVVYGTPSAPQVLAE